MPNPSSRPAGYECGHCRRFVKFAPFVFNHWHSTLAHTCTCGARSLITEGIATLKQLPQREKVRC